MLLLDETALAISGRRCLFNFDSSSFTPQTRAGLDLVETPFPIESTEPRVEVSLCGWLGDNFGDNFGDVLVRLADDLIFNRGEEEDVFPLSVAVAVVVDDDDDVVFDTDVVALCGLLQIFHFCFSYLSRIYRSWS